MLASKRAAIERLTGIHSSKKSYYAALKKKMQETAQRNTQLEIINQVARSINVDMTPGQVLESVIEKLRTVIGCEEVSLFDLAGETATVRSAALREALTAAAVLPCGPGTVVRRVAEGAGVLLWPREVTVTAAEEERMRVAGIATAAFLPLAAKGQVAGVLYVGSSLEGAYGEPELMFLRHLADQLVVCLENARLYSEVLRRKMEWEETFGAVTDLLYLIDPSFTVVRVNKAVPAFFGREAERLVGNKCYVAFHARKEPCQGCPAVAALRTNHNSFQQIRTVSGRILDVFSYPVYSERGQPYAVMQYAKDVTQFVQSIKFVALGEMAAGVAHELNSPLTAIIGDAQLLLRELAADDERRGLVEDIRNCGHRSRRIIQNLLAFSRQDEYSFGPTDLNEVADRALGLVSYQIEKNAVAIDRDLEAGLPQVVADGQRLEQVLVNLLLNARDAVEGFSGERRILVSTSLLDDDHVTIKVCDTGTGIAPDHLPHIFNPFFTTKKVGRGTGLGLSVSLGIVETHGGRIDVETKPGAGSTFTVVLPVAGRAGRPGPAAGDKPASPPGAAAGIPGRRPRARDSKEGKSGEGSQDSGGGTGGGGVMA